MIPRRPGRWRQGPARSLGRGPRRGLPERADAMERSAIALFGPYILVGALPHAPPVAIILPIEERVAHEFSIRSCRAFQP